MNENLNNNVETTNNQGQGPVVEPVPNPDLGQTQVLNPQPEQPVMPDMNVQNNVDIQSVSPNAPKANKGSLYILIGVIALIIALIGVASYYFISNNNPVNIYRNIVKNGINEAFEATEIIDDKSKASVALDLDLDLEDGLVDKEILDLINDTTLEVGYQMDKEEKQLVFMIDSEYDKDSLLNAELYFDGDDEKAYLYAEEFFDKYLEIEDVEFDEDFSKIFEDNSLFGSSAKKDKAKKILIKEITSMITKDDCYKEDGYFVFEINEKELTERLQKVLENLADNKEFIECFEDSDTFKDSLESAAESLDADYASEEEMKISIKKTFLTNKVEEVVIEYMEAKIEATVDGDEVEFKAKADSEIILSGNMKIETDRNREKAEMTFKVPDVGEIGIEIETKYESVKEIDKVKKSEVKNINDLTEDEQQELITNLQESKIYELISSFSSMGESGSEDNYDDNYSDVNVNVNSSGNTLSMYDSKKVVTYNVPSGYTLSYSDEDNEYKCYEKGDVEVCLISSYNDNEDEYLNELDDTKEYFAENYSEYQNMVLSSKISKTVNGNTFSYRNFTFDYVGYGLTTKYYQRNYIIKITGNDYYTVEVEAMDTQIPESDIESFLTISY